jgi:3-phenylpropionate/trans-cinnamate dioxygenase ferredoxin reductase subunit
MTTGAGRVVVVGASLAGATTALSLREDGFAGDIVLVGAETALPYERPALSKTYLAGDVQLDKMLVRPAGDYDSHRIELRLGQAASALDTDSRVVTLGDGEQIPYDHLVIATGASNARAPIPGIDLPGIHQLRTAADADALRTDLAGLERAVIVGMGFIGCEIAATLNGLGMHVTAVDPMPGPLWGPLGPQLSDLVRHWHEGHGIRLINGVGVSAFVPDATGSRLAAVELADGRRLDAELVVVGVGVRAATGWLADAPVHLVGGAVGVDIDGRTNLPGVYAAGDVTATWDDHLGAHVRHEHWANAIDQASASPASSPASRSPRRRSRRSGPTSSTAACSTPGTTTPTATSSSGATSPSPMRHRSRSSCAPACSSPCSPSTAARSSAEPSASSATRSTQPRWPTPPPTCASCRP